MAIRNIRRQSVNPANYPGTANAAPIYVDSDDNKLKMIPAGSGSVEVVLADGASGLTDANGTVKLLPNSAAKTIVDGSATSLFTVTTPTLAGSGGFINFLVRASDGTDFQAISGLATYSTVNKAGTSTSTITYVTTNEAKSVSAGTLTLAFTVTDGGAGVTTYKVQPTGSLTETTPYTIEYTVFPLRGTVAIL